jgi:hypothetical protein
MDKLVSKKAKEVFNELFLAKIPDPVDRHMWLVDFTQKAEACAAITGAEDKLYWICHFARTKIQETLEVCWLIQHCPQMVRIVAEHPWHGPYTLLQWAIEQQANETVRMLLRVGADPNLHDRRYSPLGRAVHYGFMETAWILMKDPRCLLTKYRYQKFYFTVPSDAKKMTKRVIHARISIFCMLAQGVRRNRTWLTRDCLRKLLDFM